MPHLPSALLASAVAALCCTAPAPAHALVELTALRYAADTTVMLGSTTIAPVLVAEDDLAGNVTPVDVGDLPPDAHIDAYHQTASGDQLLSFETTVALPGGIIAGPSDVVRRSGGVFSIALDGAANGVPDGVNIDAIAGEFLGSLIVSFDVSVRFGNATFEDEDLATYDPVADPSFRSSFVGAAAGVPSDVDIDGAQIVDDTALLVSFDGSGSVGGIAFDDHDVLEYAPGSDTWALVYDGTDNFLEWEAADLIGLYAVVAESTPTATPSATIVASAATATVTPPVGSTATATVPAGSTATATVPSGSTATATSAMTVVGTATLTPSVTATPSGTCVGDCDGNGVVAVNELVTMVNIALDAFPVANCLAGDPDEDDTVTIAELITAVNNLLGGC